MAIYLGNKKIAPYGISKVYVGNKLIWENVKTVTVEGVYTSLLFNNRGYTAHATRNLFETHYPFPGTLSSIISVDFYEGAHHIFTILGPWERIGTYYNNQHWTGTKGTLKRINSKRSSFDKAIITYKP